MKKKAGTIVIISLIIALSLIYFFRGKRNHTVEEGERFIVKREDVTVHTAETGSLVPINAVETKSEQGGEVRKIFVQAGDIVSVGQVLATLRPESNQAKRVAEARAMIDSERLDWEEVKREAERNQSLFEKGFIARREWEASSKKAESAGIQYELAKKQLLLTLGGNKTLYAKYLKMNLSAESMEDFVVVSPVSGTVIEVNVSSGAMVSSGSSTVTGGTALMRISDLSKMWIKTKINEVGIGQIREKQLAEIRLDAIPNQVYQGTVVKISPKGEMVDNIVNYEVTLEIKNPDQRLMPSMTANVDIILQTEKAVLTLPHRAVTQLEGRKNVSVLTSSGKIESRNIEVGLQNETVVVIQKGVQEGDIVILPKKTDHKEGGRR